jgi:hypothetical protein
VDQHLESGATQASKPVGLFLRAPLVNCPGCPAGRFFARLACLKSTLGGAGRQRRATVGPLDDTRFDGAPKSALRGLAKLRASPNSGSNGGARPGRGRPCTVGVYAMSPPFGSETGRGARSRAAVDGAFETGGRRGGGPQRRGSGRLLTAPRRPRDPKFQNPRPRWVSRIRDQDGS